MRYLYTILILVSFLSCTLQKKSGEYDTISIDNEDNRDLSIDPNQEGEYGPSGDGEPFGEPKKSESLVHALSVYSTLYSSFALVELFSEAEKNNIKFSIIAANGMASLISVLYAKKKSSNYLEWKLFDLNKRLSGEIPFSSSWRKTIDDFLKEEFGNMQLQQLQALVLIPEKHKGVRSLRSTGSIRQTVMRSISLENKRSFYSSPFELRERMSKLGFDLDLSVAFMADKTQFKNLTGFQWGIFTTYLSFLEKNRHIFQSINAQDEQLLDEIQPLSDIKTSFRESIQEAIKTYKDQISNRNSQNSTSAPFEI